MVTKSTQTPPARRVRDLSRRAIPFLALVTAAAAAGPTWGCKRNTESSQKNFVAKFDETFVHLAAWPAYSASQAETFVSLTTRARSYGELFTAAKASNLGTLLSPELCWFGKSTPKKLGNDGIGEVYLEKDPAYSTAKSVPCGPLMQAIAANPKLARLSARIKERAAALGADECTYLVFSLTPRFGQVLLSGMRDKGIPVNVRAGGPGSEEAPLGNGTSPGNGTAPGNTAPAKSQPPIMGLDGR